MFTFLLEWRWFASQFRCTFTAVWFIYFLNEYRMIKPLIPPVASRMATSGGEGHRHARSQTMPIIRSKNALANPKLLQMMETGNTHTHTHTHTQHVTDEYKVDWHGFELLISDLVCFFRWEYPRRGQPESDGYRGKLVHRGGPHGAGCPGALCSPPQGIRSWIYSSHHTPTVCDLFSFVKRCLISICPLYIQYILYWPVNIIVAKVIPVVYLNSLIIYILEQGVLKSVLFVFLEEEEKKKDTSTFFWV